MGSRTNVARIMAALVGVAALTAALASCRTPPDRLTVTDALTGLDRPWDLAFLPGGTMVLTERSGRIRSWDGSMLRTLAQPTDVRVGGEGGMLGLAVDPSFASNRFLYTCFVSTAPDVRVARWTLDAGGTTLGSRTDIVTGIPVSATGRHSGCRPRFGPDGHLWVGTGDAATATNPQSPTSLAGKVLRVDRNGAAAPGNPGLTDPSSPLDDRIYTYGHRNVQGLAFRPSDGRAFGIEHGTDCDDEVNALVAGGNYGWDPIGPEGPGVYDESQPMTDTTKFPDARTAVWSSGCPTIAPSGGTFLAGDRWAGWNGALAMAVLKGQQLRVFWLDPANGDRVGGDWTAVTDKGRLRSAVQGPDGNLYIATDVATPNGRILKVVPSQD